MNNIYLHFVEISFRISCVIMPALCDCLYYLCVLCPIVTNMHSLSLVLSLCKVSFLLFFFDLLLLLQQNIEPEWQSAAANLLSSLGIRYAKDVMSELLTKFQPGKLPHYFVIQTLGQLAVTNGKQQ